MLTHFCSANARFLYDGVRINEGDTPDSLGMEDGDSIDVMVERKYYESPPLIRGAVMLKTLNEQRLEVADMISHPSFTYIPQHCTFAAPFYLFAYMLYKYLAL